MKYMGSKNRIAKEILPIMLKLRGDRTWVEPFVGGGNMIDKVQGKRIGADINHYLIDELILQQLNGLFSDRLAEFLKSGLLIKSFFFQVSFLLSEILFLLPWKKVPNLLLQGVLLH